MLCAMLRIEGRVHESFGRDSPAITRPMIIVGALAYVYPVNSSPIIRQGVDAQSQR